MFADSNDYLLPCLNKKLFGIDCPGCGIQRSIVHLFHGEFTEAFFMYPAIYSLILLAFVFFLHKKFNFTTGKKIIHILAIINVAVIIISYMIKMNTLYQLT